MSRSAARALLVYVVGAVPLGVAPAAATPAVAIVTLAVDTTGGRLEAAPETRGLPIRSIRIRPRDIYDPVPPGRLGPLYRGANRLHVVSRPATVERELAFGRGQNWDDARGLETLRALRDLDFIQPIALRVAASGDSADVELETRDVWSTIPEFNLESGGGKSYGAGAFTERNLFGYGKSASVAYRSDPTGISRSVTWSDPAVAGSHARLQFAAVTGSAGVTNQVYAGVPFWSEDAPYTAFASWTRSTSVARLFERSEVAADLDERREEVEVGWGRGGRVDGIVRRLTYSFWLRNRRLGPSRLEPGAPVEFDGGEENLRIRRLAAELRLWQPHFVERRSVDRMSGLEDFDVGPLVSVKLGFSPRILGASTDESYAQFGLDGGTATPLGFGTVHASMATRFRYRPEELIRSVDARWVSQMFPGQTLVAAGAGIWGLRMARDWQTVIGGLNGLRAFPVHALAGRQAWRFNLEDRWLIGREYWELVNVGLAAFWDGARVWGPGSAGTDWYHDAGVGVRLALPHMSSNQVIRLDVAWPVRPTPASGRDAVFSFGSRQAF